MLLHARKRKFSEEEMRMYESSASEYVKLEPYFGKARLEGREEGREEGRKIGEIIANAANQRKFVVNLLNMGLTIEKICEAAECSEDFVIVISKEIGIPINYGDKPNKPNSVKNLSLDD